MFLCGQYEIYILRVVSTMKIFTLRNQTSPSGLKEGSIYRTPSGSHRRLNKPCSYIKLVLNLLLEFVFKPHSHANVTEAGLFQAGFLK